MRWIAEGTASGSAALQIECNVARSTLAAKGAAATGERVAVD